jgi:hypothetical protein
MFSNTVLCNKSIPGTNFILDPGILGSYNIIMIQDFSILFPFLKKILAGI